MSNLEIIPKSERHWYRTFRERMHGFRLSRDRLGDQGNALSIKIRVESGAFDASSSPRAFELIYALETGLPDNVEYVSHESGPELLVYAAAASAVISLAKSVIDLVTAIIKARSEGIKKGDRHKDPLVLIVRRMTKKGKFCEEIVMRAPHDAELDRSEVERLLNNAANRLLKD